MGKVFRLTGELNLSLSCFGLSALYSRIYCMYCNSKRDSNRYLLVPILFAQNTLSEQNRLIVIIGGGLIVFFNDIKGAVSRDFLQFFYAMKISHLGP